MIGIKESSSSNSKEKEGINEKKMKRTKRDRLYNDLKKKSYFYKQMLHP